MTGISEIAAANNAYKNVASTKFGVGGPNLSSGAKIQFSDVIKASVTNHYKMPPEQVLNSITNTGVAQSSQGIATEGLKQLNKELEKTRKVSGKVIDDEASLLDMTFQANKPRQIIEAVAKFRDTAVGALDKIFNMQIWYYSI